MRRGAGGRDICLGDVLNGMENLVLSRKPRCTYMGIESFMSGHNFQCQVRTKQELLVDFSALCSGSLSTMAQRRGIVREAHSSQLILQTF